jgi:hypothetical protein
MRVEQIVSLVYTLLGLLSSFLTNHLYSIGFGLVIAVVTSFAIYFASLPLLIAFVKDKKKTILLNSFITFLLIWLTMWILIYNL